MFSSTTWGHYLPRLLHGVIVNNKSTIMHEGVFIKDREWCTFSGILASLWSSWPHTPGGDGAGAGDLEALGRLRLSGLIGDRKPGEPGLFRKDGGGWAELKASDIWGLRDGGQIWGRLGVSYIGTHWYQSPCLLSIIPSGFSRLPHIQPHPNLCCLHQSPNKQFFKQMSVLKYPRSTPEHPCTPMKTCIIFFVIFCHSTVRILVTFQII